MEALNLRRRQQQGLGRPIISTDMDGLRFVAVGNRVYRSSKWRTFHDFLGDYLLGGLGYKWANAELAKPAEHRHPIMLWHAQAVEVAKAMKRPPGVVNAPMTGAIQAFLNLAYNIYLIAHHADGQKMADKYLNRLRSARKDDFIGALFETYAAAAFLKAGFTLAYEETERRSTSCVEFVATWPKTIEKFSVEVKSRNHTTDLEEGVQPLDGARRLRVGAKLVKALRKSAAHTRVVMIEVNIPDRLTETQSLKGWPAAALAEIRGNETAVQPDGSLYPPAYVFVTNHSFHHDLTGLARSTQSLAAGFRIPDFGPDVRHAGYAGLMAARDRHPAMIALISSMKTHYEIPATFNGELPSSLVRAASDAPRLCLGERYLIRSAEGREMVGRFDNATVDIKSGQVYGVYELDDGKCVIATNTLTPEELEEYCRYPDTYFGAVLKPGRKADNHVDLCDFLFESYRATPREKLLEFMAHAPDIEQLRTLSQRDLAALIQRVEARVAA